MITQNFTLAQIASNEASFSFRYLPLLMAHQLPHTLCCPSAWWVPDKWLIFVSILVIICANLQCDHTSRWVSFHCHPKSPATNHYFSFLSVSMAVSRCVKAMQPGLTATHQVSFPTKKYGYYTSDYDQRIKRADPRFNCYVSLTFKNHPLIRCQVAYSIQDFSAITLRIWRQGHIVLANVSGVVWQAPPKPEDHSHRSPRAMKITVKGPLTSSYHLGIGICNVLWKFSC